MSQLAEVSRSGVDAVLLHPLRNAVTALCVTALLLPYVTGVAVARGLLDQAEEHLIQAAELTGGDPVVSEHLGDVMLLRGDKQSALDYYEEAVELEVRESEQPNLLDKLDQLRNDLGGTAQTDEAP